jgi:hypothetical protein
MKTLTFPCPEDIEPVLVESCESYYIRARITTVENEFKYNGHYIAPVLSHTEFCYHYKEEGVEPNEMMAINNMEWMKRCFKPFYQTEASGYYFGFSSPPCDGPIRLLFSLSEKRELKASHLLRWEYLGKDGFTRLNVMDETRNFEKTGLVTFMGRNDFQLKRLFGEEMYWIRILCNMDVKFPIKGIHINSVRVKAMEGGERTNLEAGSKLKLERSYGFINFVTNVEPISGGKDLEEVSASIKRNATALRHRNRAVTERDYEQLAMEASRDILYAKCFGNRDKKGEKRSGHVTLVVVCDNGNQRFSGWDLTRFEMIKNEMLHYFKDKVEERLLGSGRFQIIQPTYLECGIGAELVISEMNGAFAAKKDAEEKLGEYLNEPRIGDLPNRMQVKNILGRIPNVNLVRNVHFLASHTEEPYNFVVNGLHDITVNVE